MKNILFVEPSKVGTQHITLIEGYLYAAINFSISNSSKVEAYLSKSTIKELKIKHNNFVSKEIQVMNPEKRNLILKSILEFIVTLRLVLKADKNQLMIVTCMLPTSLLALELFMKIFRIKRNKLYVCLHGEIEYLLTEKILNPLRIGFWSNLWFQIRNKKSNIKLILLDEFIKEKLLDKFHHKLKESSLFVLPFPLPLIRPSKELSSNIKSSKSTNKFKICFIGYKTEQKRYDRFKNLSEIMSDYEFFYIGGGKCINLSNNQISYFSSKDDYINSIRMMDFAIFPYNSGGYNLSMSAAMLDALFNGLIIISTDLGCARGLNKKYSNRVIVYETFQELTSDFSNCIQRNAIKINERKNIFMQKIKTSNYSVDNISNQIAILYN